MIYSARKKTIFIVLIWLFSLISFTKAEQSTWWDFWSDPVNILDNVKKDANGEYKIQETAFDWVTSAQWSSQSSRKISNTLDYVKNHISQYLQRIVFLWLALGVIWLIWNWLMMVTKTFNKQWDMATVKKNIANIWIWIIILTWFYAIIQIMTSLLNMVFKK
jgi:hypothetical protein